MHILGLKPGEAAIYRNIGGRINAASIATMILLPIVTKAVGQETGPGWNLIILHHTDCGIVGCYKFAPDLLAAHLGVTRSELDTMAITDPAKQLPWMSQLTRPTRIFRAVS
jgi:carbonic anhydrase